MLDLNNIYAHPPTGSSHNYLRISRILKCLSEMGLEHLNAGFLLHFLNEQSEHDELNNRSLVGSMDRWWANCVRNQDERKWINETIKKARNEPDFVFSEDAYRDALQRRQKTGSLSE